MQSFLAFFPHISERVRFSAASHLTTTLGDCTDDEDDDVFFKLRKFGQCNGYRHSNAKSEGLVQSPVNAI